MLLWDIHVWLCISWCLRECAGRGWGAWGFVVKCGVYPIAWRPWRPVISCTGAVVAGACGMCPAGTYQTGPGPRAQPHTLYIFNQRNVLSIGPVIMESVK